MWINGVCRSHKKSLRSTTINTSFSFLLQVFFAFALFYIVLHLTNTCQELCWAREWARDYSLEQHFSSHKWHHKLAFYCTRCIHEARTICSRDLSTIVVCINFSFKFLTHRRMEKCRDFFIFFSFISIRINLALPSVWFFIIMCSAFKCKFMSQHIFSISSSSLSHNWILLLCTF